VDFVRVINKSDQWRIGAVDLGGVNDFIRSCAMRN
jgi:hypothetical protein